MTTVQDLIAHLQTLPPETEVLCLKEVSCGWSYSTSFVPLVIESHLDFVDFRNNEFVGPDHPFFGKAALYIGEN